MQELPSSAVLESAFSAGPYIKPFGKNRVKTRRLSAFMTLCLNKGCRTDAIWRVVDAWLYGSLDDLEREAEAALAGPEAQVPSPNVIDDILDEVGPEDDDFNEEVDEPTLEPPVMPAPDNAE
jgi:hypothetical protein